MGRLSIVQSSTAIALFGLVITGCANAGSRGTVKAVAPADLPALVGVWHGTMTGMSGANFRATLTFNADGTYVVRGGAFTAQGRTEVREGRLDFISTATSGVGSTGDRIGTAVVLDRGDTWGVVGWGQSPAGPYNFEFSRTR